MSTPSNSKLSATQLTETQHAKTPPATFGKRLVKFTIEVGEDLVGRKYLKLQGGKRRANFEYVVQTVKVTGIVLKDLSGAQVVQPTLDLIKNNFIQS